MNFRPELAEKVKAGQKTVTRRTLSPNPRSPWWAERCALVAGRDYAVCPGRGKVAVCRVKIVKAEKVRLGRLDDFEAWREGFDSAAAFVETWEALHRVYDPDLVVWRVQFTLMAEVVKL